MLSSKVWMKESVKFVNDMISWKQSGYSSYKILYTLYSMFTLKSWNLARNPFVFKYVPVICRHISLT